MFLEFITLTVFWFVCGIFAIYIFSNKFREYMDISDHIITVLLGLVGGPIALLIRGILSRK